MNNVVIIGAGRTGRGYLARQIPTDQWNLTFLDKNVSLVKKLNEKKQFTIEFYSLKREKMIVKDYSAYVIDSEEGVKALAEADLVFTAVGEQNLSDITQILKEAFNVRSKREKIKVVTAENGISPKKRLLEELSEENFIVSEAVIFCTTNSKNEIDILSEDLDYIPYDIKSLDAPIDFPHFSAEEKFHDLLQRKIYTYNCLSACISYLGYCLGYESYGDAANDKNILSIMKELKNQLSYALSSKYNITFEAQDQFGNMAIAKFTNQNIEDTVSRNGRNVVRKLGKQERIMAPLSILEEYGQRTDIMQWIAAAAMLYGNRQENIKEEKLIRLLEKNCTSQNSRTISNITEKYNLLKNSNNKKETLVLVASIVQK